MPSSCEGGQVDRRAKENLDMMFTTLLIHDRELPLNLDESTYFYQKAHTKDLSTYLSVV
jgi:hypothetical protein